MEIYGQFDRMLDTIEGDSTNGHWKRGSFVIVTGDEIERFVAFTFKKEDLFTTIPTLRKGQRMKVRFFPESREFDGRYYTDLKCTAIDY